MLCAVSLYLFALAASASPAANVRPACTSSLAGQFYPLEANRDARLAFKLARCGELEICTRGVWKYRWRPLTVRLDQLSRSNAIKKPAGCEAPLENAAAEPNDAKSSAGVPK